MFTSNSSSWASTAFFWPLRALAHMCIHSHVHMHACMHVYTHMHTSTHTHTLTYTWLHVYTRVHVHICKCICIYIHVCIQSHVHKHARTHTLTPYTHRHTCRQTPLHIKTFKRNLGTQEEKAKAGTTSFIRLSEKTESLMVKSFILTRNKKRGQ